MCLARYEAEHCDGERREDSPPGHPGEHPDGSAGPQPLAILTDRLCLFRAEVRWPSLDYWSTGSSPWTRSFSSPTGERRPGTASGCHWIRSRTIPHWFSETSTQESFSVRLPQLAEETPSLSVTGLPVTV